MENNQHCVGTDGPYLRAAGEERLDVNVGVVNFEVMVPEPASHADGGEYPRL